MTEASGRAGTTSDEQTTGELSRGLLHGALRPHLVLDTRRSGPATWDTSDGRLLTLSPAGVPSVHRPGRGLAGYSEPLPLTVAFPVVAAWLDAGATLLAGARGELELHRPGGTVLPFTAGTDPVRVATIFHDERGPVALSADSAGHVREFAPGGQRTAARTAPVGGMVVDPTGRYAARQLTTGGFMLHHLADSADAPLAATRVWWRRRASRRMVGGCCPTARTRRGCGTLPPYR